MIVYMLISPLIRQNLVLKNIKIYIRFELTCLMKESHFLVIYVFNIMMRMEMMLLLSKEEKNIIKTPIKYVKMAVDS